MDSPPSTFEPLRPASRGWRAFVLFAGPLLWLAGLIVATYVLRYSEAVEVALAVVAVSLLVDRRARPDADTASP